jgi:hypothetical protein
LFVPQVLGDDGGLRQAVPRVPGVGGDDYTVGSTIWSIGC